MTSERRLAVLKAIIESYVSTREPVPSKVIAESGVVNVSSATIRNDMAALEEAGLITAPHTSAGRIPTDAGYRAFVDHLRRIKPLSPAQRNAISAVLDGADDLDEVMHRAVGLMSDLTQQVAMIQYPVDVQARIVSAELLSLNEHQSMLLFVTSQGKVAQAVFSESLSPVQAETARVWLRERVLGRSIAECQARLALSEQEAARMAGLGIPGSVLREAELVRAKLVGSRLVLSGTAYLARTPSDFSDSITPVLQALEEQMIILGLLSDVAKRREQMSVLIGAENAEGLRETALVLAPYGQGASGSEGTLGVLGPTRMDYPTSMAVVAAVSGYVTEILHR